ncbi:MAG: glycosyltransferase family 2 protein [Planctomycetes bacterium]|nr:glycosyltransferase family 2 protein [Planctomycetota bacterium]
MSLIAVAIVAAIAMLVGFQAMLTIGYLRVLRQGAFPVRTVDDECPRVAVILCLRGVDPFLEQTLRQLLAQDYPNFDIRIVLDSRDDPAWALVESVLQSAPASNARVELLARPREVCTLKCSSLVQTVEQLDDSYQVVALLDADTVPHATWLRELVAPLAAADVGAATGNRWYMPTHASWGAITRYLWNAAAVVQMYWYRIAWGGTLAIKLSALRESGLLERWGHAFCEDTMTFSALRRLGLRVQFVPSLLMVNREDCSCTGFFRWMRRQLLAARLYHPGWLAVVAHGLGVVALLFVALVCGIVALVTGQTVLFWGMVALGVAYFCSTFLLARLMERVAGRVVAARGEPNRWMTTGTAVRCLLAMPAAHLLHAVAMLTAIFVRRVDWRGVQYEIGGPFAVKLVRYEPFRAAADELQTMKSL